MAIDEENNGYPEWSCTRENLNMHIENDQSGCRCVPGQWSMRRYQEVRLVYNKEHKTYHMRHQIEIKNCSRENWIFEIYLKIGILKLNTRMRVLEIKFERNWNFGELNLGIGILKNYLKTKS